jgi:hypothetical protein
MMKEIDQGGLGGVWWGERVVINQNKVNQLEKGLGFTTEIHALNYININHFLFLLWKKIIKRKKPTMTKRDVLSKLKN